MRGIFMIDGQRIEAEWVSDRWLPDTLPDGSTRLIRDEPSEPHRKPGHWEAILPDGRSVSNLDLPAGALFFEEDDESLIR